MSDWYLMKNTLNIETHLFVICFLSYKTLIIRGFLFGRQRLTLLSPGKYHTKLNFNSKRLPLNIFMGMENLPFKRLA